MIKKLVLNILLVAAVVFVLDFAIGRTLRHFYFREVAGFHYRTTYSMEKTNEEVLVFGASRANHHYVPSVFEDSLQLSFYNTGRDGNGIFYQAALLRSVLKRYTPKVIILDYKGEFWKGPQEYDQMSSLVPYYRTHEEIRDLVELRGRWERVKLLSETYPFNSQALTIAIGNMDMNKQRNADTKGYVPLESDRAPALRVYTRGELYVVDSTKVNAFREFVVNARKSGAKVYVIYSPLYQKLALYQEVDICRQICEENNVPFLDFSRDKFWLERGNLFYDGVHLNHQGATLFSTMIAGYIKRDLEQSPLPAKTPQ
jgi:hypothetical protein